MVIIVILASISLPAILKSRSQAAINKAKAVMASLASTGNTIYLDLRSLGYVRLADYSMPEATDLAVAPKKILQSQGYSEDTFTTGVGGDFVDLDDFNACWDGPYAVFQPKTTFVAGSVGTPPVLDTGVSGWTPPANYFPDDTPLDPWGHPYGMGWNDTEKVMVIYSAGPDGKLQTGCGAVDVGDANANGIIDTGEAGSGSDDLLYKFR